MKEWKLTAFMLCAFGLLKELQPSDFFMTEYLIDHKHFPKEVIVHEAYPISTYTYFAVLPFIFLFTDYLKYRPIIYLEAGSFVALYALMIWGAGINALRVIRILRGVAHAAEIAYLTYIYAKVDKGHYKKVTSYVHSAAFVGTLLASTISQILVSFDIMDFHDLNYISLGGVSLALVLATFLPSTKESVYFNRRQSVFPTLTVPIHAITSNHVLNHFHNPGARRESYELSKAKSSSPTSNSENIEDNIINTQNKRKATLVAFEGQIISSSTDKRHRLSSIGSMKQVRIIITQPPASLLQRFRKAYRYLWKHFKEAYRNVYVLKWSLWWAMAMAGNLQVVEYYEALWDEITPDHTIHRDHEVREHKVYNGGVNAIQCALSTAFALTVGAVHIHWFKWGETVLCIISIVQGLCLIWMSMTEEIMIAYALYIVYKTLYQVLITVASAEVAEKISEDSHGLVFGFNTFMAVCIQTILTLIVTDRAGLDLDIRLEFLVYGCYYIVLGFAFIFVAIYIFSKHGCIQLEWKLPNVVEPQV